MKNARRIENDDAYSYDLRVRFKNKWKTHVKGMLLYSDLYRAGCLVFELANLYIVKRVYL